MGERGTVGALVPAGFERIVRVDAPRAERHGLAREVLTSVVELGEAATSTRDSICVAVWEGWGWETAQMLRANTEPRRWFQRRGPQSDSLGSAKDMLGAELAELPRLELEQRTYRLLSGPAQAVLTMHDPVTVWGDLVPDLFWPADRAWFVASDTDIAWTYVAGASNFTAALLEAWPDATGLVGWSDPLA